MKELSKIIDCFGTTEALTVGLDGAAHRHILLRRNDTPYERNEALNILKYNAKFDSAFQFYTFEEIVFVRQLDI